jgi:putative membrane-bound dehydrogenase-like protein
MTNYRVRVCSPAFRRSGNASDRLKPELQTRRLVIGAWSFIGHCVIGRWSLLLSLLIPLTLSAAEPTIDSKDLPRTPALEPGEALSSFKVRPGFRLELVAAEPLVVDPIAMSFDEDGRLFVVEMRDYSERRDDRMGRIRMLEDTDGDGRFDKSTVFADNLPWPTAVFRTSGGVLVGTTPDIIFFKDTNGDGKADTREVVFSGFASDYAPYQTNRLNVQAMLNSFNWGLDNRIHGATSMNGGRVISLRHPGAKVLELRGHDFAINPRDMSIIAEAGGGQHGLSFDDQGRRFACQNSDHIRLYMYDERYGLRNSFYAMPPAWASIAADGPAAEVYRISPDEPWRVIRTRWRVAGQVSGPVEGGGRPSGYFTGATGVTIYRGDAFPADSQGDAFIADCGSNLVHRKKLHRHGVELLAKRADDEQKAEFLACKDIWFRPVQFANAPDGTLYIADMYREVIEHPWSIPQSIKQHLDLNSGNDRGRIYRIVPDGFKQRKPPRLAKASTSELVATLEHSNGWHRDTAARLLYERQDKAAVAGLKTICRGSKSALGRMHSLCALDGLASLDGEILLGALADSDERVREHAVRLSEKFLKRNDSGKDPLAEKILALAADPSQGVRYQVAFTLGELDGSEKISALAEVARRDVESPWVRAAVLSSLANGTGELFASLSNDQEFHRAKGSQDFLRQLVFLIGARNKTTEVSQALAFSTGASDAALGFALIRALGEGLQRAGSSLEKAGGNISSVFARAAATALDGKASEAARIQAVQLLGLARFEEASAALVPILNLSQSQAVQLAAISNLGRFNRLEVASELTNRWSSFTPQLRGEALTVLLARPERAMTLLKAVEQGAIRLSDLSSTQRKFLCSHRDPKLRQRAIAVLGNSPATEREQIVKSLLAALNLQGDSTHGKATYSERCSPCHRLGLDGHAVGPDLVSVKSSGKEKMLVNIIDPNREVQPAYLSYLIETKEDESLLGIIANETATTVTLREAFGKETVVPRSNIKKLQSLGQSLMPEGLEVGLTAQSLADLLEYITTFQP